MSVRILHGDCREVLKTLLSESVHCVVSSPPYFQLRDYGCAGQIGIEPTPDEYVAEIVGVFREVRRVLRNDGTVWLNLGDSYASSQANGGQRDFSTSGLKRDGRSEASRVRTLTQNAKELRRAQPKQRISHGLKPKDIIGIPWLVAFALRADGWYLRQDIIWAKPNPMPESVTDRCTKAHEYIFLLSKSARYFYDAEAVREEAEYGRRVWSDVEAVMASATFAGDTRANHGIRAKSSVTGGDPSAGRNRRSVWTVATQPYSEAHFATFPPELIEPCIKAGCPVGGTVLDPFFGAGTTGLVADRLQRNCIGIELNPEYVAMSEARLSNDRGGLLDAMEAAE